MTEPIVPHLFSVDVEEYFHANAMEAAAPRERWPELPSRVVPTTQRLLELLDRHDARGTFFVLGWVAERHPGLVREIAAAGHEVASHGWWHRKLTRITPDEAALELRESRALLSTLSGQPVLGFRAPSFSVRPGMEWVFDALLDAGYRYDSSVFPIRRPDYGWPGAPAVPYVIDRPGGRLLEVPLATTVLGGLRLPAAGGGYLRQLPLGVIQRAFREGRDAREPRMLYIHPWDTDPDQPRLPVGWLTRQRHYGGLSRALPRLERLCAEFRFAAVRDVLPTLGRSTMA